MDRAAELAAIARFASERGVTKCPAAVCAPLMEGVQRSEEESVRFEIRPEPVLQQGKWGSGRCGDKERKRLIMEARGAMDRATEIVKIDSFIAERGVTQVSPRKPGPKTNKMDGKVVVTRLSDSQRAAIDDWRSQQRPIPQIADAIRLLIAAGLKAELG